MHFAWQCFSSQCRSLAVEILAVNVKSPILFEQDIRAILEIEIIGLKSRLPKHWKHFMLFRLSTWTRPFHHRFKSCAGLTSFLHSYWYLLQITCVSMKFGEIGVKTWRGQKVRDMSIYMLTAVPCWWTGKWNTMCLSRLTNALEGAVAWN